MQDLRRRAVENGDQAAPAPHFDSHQPEPQSRPVIRPHVSRWSSVAEVGMGASVLFVAEAVSAALVGIIVGRLKLALAIFTALYVLHAIPAVLGWYGALSEWDDVPYWLGGFVLDSVLVVCGVGARRLVQRGVRRQARDRPG